MTYRALGLAVVAALALSAAAPATQAKPKVRTAPHPTYAEPYEARVPATPAPTTPANNDVRGSANGA